MMGEQCSAVSARLRLGTREIASLLGGDLKKGDRAGTFGSAGLCHAHVKFYLTFS
jgi:hypothetical protein